MAKMIMKSDLPSKKTVQDAVSHLLGARNGRATGMGLNFAPTAVARREAPLLDYPVMATRGQTIADDMS